MQRRKLLFATAVASLVSWDAAGQMQPFALRLVRRAGWEELMGRNLCIVSDLYASNPAFPRSDLGNRIGVALELAYRNNLSEISAIPGGEYRGGIREDGKLGWRIELHGVSERQNIEIHIGNTRLDSVGCILPGSGEGNDHGCFVPSSGAALRKIRDMYGTSVSRPVVLRIEPIPIKTRVDVPASDFVRGTNVALGGPPNSAFGQDVLLNGPPYTQQRNAAEFEFRAQAGGNYRLVAEFASVEPRPAQIFLNGSLVLKNALASSTGCWTPNCQRMIDQGTVVLRQGSNVMRVERNSIFPHIRSFSFIPVE